MSAGQLPPVRLARVTRYRLRDRVPHPTFGLNRLSASPLAAERAIVCVRSPVVNRNVIERNGSGGRT